MDDRGEVLYELSPKFDFIYELTMPTGKKMKSAFVGALVTGIFNILMLALKSKIIDSTESKFAMIYNTMQIIFLIAFVFLLVLFIARVVLQSLEYKGIKYKFCKDCMIYENSFLNQTKKTIEYENIKEIEIRRSIIDRILNYGIIIIYTNAEKARGGATVIYAIKNTEEHYKVIENLVHNGKVVSSPIKTGNVDADIRAGMDLQNAMDRNETYNETTAESDVNPLNKQNN